MDSDATRRFEQDWARAREGVWRFCLWSAPTRADAEDLFQTVALRAWRGYPTFKGECSFATWVGAIARNAASSMGTQAGRRKESGIGDAAVVAAAESAAQRQRELRTADDTDQVLDRLGAGWMSASVQDLLDDAVIDDAISALEADVVRARAADPEDHWDVVGARLDLSPNHCSVVHSRAMPKLRVYLFRRRPDLLGGPDALHAAFRAAQAGSRPLTPAEAAAFEQAILLGRVDYRRHGWQNHLRGAVAKVAAYTRLVEW
jgi:RNA polymerase sigma factor (sigma-70 family)